MGAQWGRDNSTVYTDRPHRQGGGERVNRISKYEIFRVSGGTWI